MAKHIIDTESPEFDDLSIRQRKAWAGMILLERDCWQEDDISVLKGLKKVGDLKGVITIEPETLTKKVIEVFRPEALADMSVEYHNRPFAEYLADDMNGDNKTGHKKYAKIHEELMDDDFVKTLLQAKGVTLPEIAQIKTKFQDAQSS